MIIEPSPEDIERYSEKPKPIWQPTVDLGRKPVDYIWRQNPFVETPWREPANSYNSLINMKYTMMVAGLIDDRSNHRMVLTGALDDGCPSMTDEELEAYYKKQAQIARTLMMAWPGSKHRKMRRLIRRYRKRVGRLAPGPVWIGYYRDYLQRKYERIEDDRTEERSANQPNQEASGARE
jgi:hypothetical protein